MTDPLRNVPVYHNLNEIADAMKRAREDDKDEWEMSETDRVLAGLVCYLAEHYVSPLFQEPIYQIVDTYCASNQ